MPLIVWTQFSGLRYQDFAGAKEVGSGGSRKLLSIFGVPYESRTRVAAVKEKRFTVIQKTLRMDSTLPHGKVKGRSRCGSATGGG